MSNQQPSQCPFEHPVIPDEAEQIAELDQLTVELLDQRYPDTEILRGVHPKSHGCVKAKFKINSDIDETLQVGLFCTPGQEFDAAIRFSNATALVLPDVSEAGENSSRGMAIKVFTVGGDVLLDDDGADNQDFLMINQPMFAFASSRDYLRLERILRKFNDEAASFFTPLGLQKPGISEAEKQFIQQYIIDQGLTQQDLQRILDTFKIVKQIQATPTSNPVNAQYFGAAPFLFGPDRVMKFSAKPRAQLEPTKISENPEDNYLRAALKATMEQNDEVVFDFIVQVRAGGDDLGIENASTLWDEATYPFINVAVVTIPAPQQDIDNPDSLAHCKNMAFTPWHSLVEHQPIGSINRLRKSVYQASAEHRGANADIDTAPDTDMPAIIRLCENLLKSLFGKT